MIKHSPHYPYIRTPMEVDKRPFFMMAHVIVECVRNQFHMILLLEYSQKFVSVVYFQRSARFV